MVTIRPEYPEDRDAVFRVNAAAFEGPAEAELVDALRDGGEVALSLVAESDGAIVGHILFSRVTIESPHGDVSALSLAPMAVAPDSQRQGIGTQLVQSGLERCREQGHRIVLVLGHPAYYPRFGFSSALAQSLTSPFGGGDAWMGIELQPGALDGVAGEVRFSSPFHRFL